jgi:hypothetical protein
MLPHRFAVWEADEFQTGVIQICNTQTLHYNYEQVFRIYPEEESRHRHLLRGRLRHSGWDRQQFGRATVQLSHHQSNIIYFCLTPFTVNPFNLHTGGRVDENLPVVIIYGDYLYGSRSPYLYSMELVDMHQWRHSIEDMYRELLNAFNLPLMRHQPAVPEIHRRSRERTHRRPRTPSPSQLRQPSQREPSQASLERPSERIALAIARDFQRQGETCPITQEPLKAGDICVTGCLCVFQGDALQAWARGHSTCPSCRKQLIYRTVTVGSEENIMIGH